MSDWRSLTGRGYRLMLVAIHDVTGVVIPVHEFTEFLVPKVREVLNDIDEMAFTIKVQDLGAGFLEIVPQPYYRAEVQLWKHDAVIFWGVVVGVTATTSTATFECRSLELYLRQRRPGPAAQTELIVNPSFEDSAPGSPPSGWTEVTPSGVSFVEVETPTDHVLLGDQMVLVGGSAATDAYLYQGFTLTAPATAALPFEFSAWYMSSIPGDYIGASYLDRGLFVARYTSPGLVLIDSLNAPWDQTATDQRWRRLSVNSSVPAGTTQFVVVALYMPVGVVFWDAAALRRRFATYTVYGEDRRELARRLVEQAAMGGIVANSQGGGPNGDMQSEIVHPPVHIQWAPENGDVGDTRPVYIDHDTSSDFLTLLQDFPRLGLADFSIDKTDGTRRLFRLHVPSRGTYKPEHALEVGRNIVGLDYNLSSGNVADQLLPNGLDWSNTLPDPQPTDRDIWAQVSPTPGSDLQQIEDFIPLERARRENPSPISSVRVLANSPEGQSLAVGDTVPIRASLGFLPGANGDYRIVARSLDTRSEIVTYEVASA